MSSKNESTRSVPSPPHPGKLEQVPKKRYLYPGGDPNYIKNAATYYANRPQVKQNNNISPSGNKNIHVDYEEDDLIRIIKFKTPGNTWEEEWYESDIEHMSSHQAWIRYIKLRDLQLHSKNNDIKTWEDIQYLIVEYPFIFEYNKYGHEFGELYDYRYYSGDEYYHDDIDYIDEQEKLSYSDKDINDDDDYDY